MRSDKRNKEKWKEFLAFVEGWQLLGNTVTPSDADRVKYNHIPKYGQCHVHFLDDGNYMECWYVDFTREVILTVWRATVKGVSFKNCGDRHPNWKEIYNNLEGDK